MCRLRTPLGDEADVHKVDSRSVNGVEQAREVSIINESGLYHLVLMSKKPEAKKFRKSLKYKASVKMAGSPLLKRGHWFDTIRVAG